MIGTSQSRCLRRAGRGERGDVLVRALARTIVLLLGLALGACGSVSGFVSDHWPTWAGGEPNGVPPRPGAPGYAEFMARQQSKAVPATVQGTASAPPGAGATPAVENVNTQAVPSPAPRVNDQGAVEGGLY
jgi:hypothetical protein